MQLSTFVFSVLVLVVSLFPGTLNGQDQGVGDEAPLVDELVWPELDAGYYAIYLDNDMFGGTDEEYTNGVRLAWMSKAKKLIN
jgi:hypothetical protein